MCETVGDPIEFDLNFFLVFVLEVGFFPKKVHFLEPIFTVNVFYLGSFVSIQIAFRKDPFYGVPEFYGSREPDIA